MGNKSPSQSATSSSSSIPHFECYSCVQPDDTPIHLHPGSLPIQNLQDLDQASLEPAEASRDIRIDSGIILEACVKAVPLIYPNYQDNQATVAQSIHKEPPWKWPNGEVPYEIDDEITKKYPELHKSVIGAIENFHLSTRITFRWRKRLDKCWIIFKHHPSETNSKVGRQGRKQTINLQPSSLTGHVMHEIMHALGFHHEHSRADRDYYVTLDVDRVSKDFTHNYRKEGYPLGNYDPESIMHYGSSYPMRGKSRSLSKKMGQREKFSQGDLNAILYVYSEPQCTYDIFREEYFAQTYYECFTCWGPESDYGVCEYCAIKCHEGHKMVRHDYTELADERMKFLCDCGRNKHEIDVCTKVSTNSKYVKQLMYVCYDCLDVEKYKKMKRGQQRGICNTCVKRCHAEHKTEKIGIIEGACDCGKKNCGAQSIY
jgi:hypothetical protein